METNLLNNWRLLGKYLGFNPCCIEFFCIAPASEIRANQDVAAHLGYVPCNVCANRIRNGEVMLHELVGSQNPRLTEHPFPTNNINWHHDPGFAAYMEKQGYTLS